MGLRAAASVRQQKNTSQLKYGGWAGRAGASQIIMVIGMHDGVRIHGKDWPACLSLARSMPSEEISVEELR